MRRLRKEKQHAAGRRRRPTAALAALLALAPACAPQPPGEPPHGIVLVVLDTLRADGLSAYGNPRRTSPALDRLAATGVLFENAVSHAAWTLPGFVGLLAGRYPSRAVFTGGKLQTSLVEALRRAGYATAAFTEGGYVSSEFGMDRGFDSYWEEEGAIYLPRPGGATPAGPGSGGIERTFDAAIDWLGREGARPFFLLIHTYEVHAPYRRRAFARALPSGSLGPSYEVRDVEEVAAGRLPVGPTEIAYVRALYDGGVRAADRQVARLLGALHRLGLAERTLIAVTSDHGEDLGERRPSSLGRHGHAVYDTLLRVPLILHDPRRRYPRARVAVQVRLIDVMPTLLDLAGVPPDPADGGRSLLPLMLGRESGDRPAYSEVLRAGSGAVRHASLRSRAHKLIANPPPRDRGTPALELYDLAADPDERSNLAAAQPERRNELAVQLKRERDAIEAGGPLAYGVDELPAPVRARLRALGYGE